MGCCCCLFSRDSSTKPSDFVRVVHANGFVEDFTIPVTTSRVIGNPTNHFMCSSTQLLSIGFKPLRPDDLLEPGRVHFALPYSVLQSPESSPLDLAAVVRRLTAVARQAGPAAPVDVGFLSRGSDATLVKVEAAGEGKDGKMINVWRPMLETIKELSFRMSTSSEVSAGFGSDRMEVRDTHMATVGKGASVWTTR